MAVVEMLPFGARRAANGKDVLRVLGKPDFIPRGIAVLRHLGS